MIVSLIAFDYKYYTSDYKPQKSGISGDYRI